MGTEVNTSYDNQLFYEWLGLAEKWITEEESFDSDYPSQPHLPTRDDDPNNSLAAHIIETVFELELYQDDKRQYGSYLPGYDVVNRDPYQMIQLSLAKHLGDDIPVFVECYADENGVVRFYPIGTNFSNITDKVLYSTTTSVLKQKCDNVLVIGYDPPKKKFTGDPINVLTFYKDTPGAWDETTYTNLYPEYVDNDVYPILWVFGDIIGPDDCDYYKKGAVEYKEFRYNDEKFLNNNEIISYYDFEKVIGWLYAIEIPFFDPRSTQVEFSNTTSRYIQLPGFGRLQGKTWLNSETYKSPLCIEDLYEDADETLGVRIPGSNNPKFRGVRNVYIHGFALTQVDVAEEFQEQDNELTIVSDPDADFIVDLDTMFNTPIALSPGDDYVVVKEPVDPNTNLSYHRIIFSCNVDPIMITKYGGLIVEDSEDLEQAANAASSLKTDYVHGADAAITTSNIKIATSSIYADIEASRYACEILGLTDIDCEGYLKDGVLKVSNTDAYEVVIFPTGTGNSGYAMLVKDHTDLNGKTLRRGRMVVECEWDNPSIVFNDTENTITKENLNSVTFEAYPIISKDSPAPIAHSTYGLLEPASSLPDLESDTVENLTENYYSRARQLENADVSLTLPFLTGDQCLNVASFIKQLQNDEVESTTYVCEPDAEPVLGEIIDNKVINSIDYSFQDSSQYLISVQAGPIWQGHGGWDQSTYQNQTEELQKQGIIRWVSEDNTSCLVDVEDLGYMTCVNGQTNLLHIGDVVKVTVHNNPVSL